MFEVQTWLASPENSENWLNKYDPWSAWNVFVIDAQPAHHVCVCVDTFHCRLDPVSYLSDAMTDKYK